jgi:beta-glucanase (GH16 family)
MTDLQLELDATDWHTYAAAWDAHQTRFSIDDQLVRTIPRVTGGWHEIRADG